VDVKLLSPRPRLATHRPGTDVLRLADGSLRAVFECASPAARLAEALRAVTGMAHPVQLVARSRRSVHRGASTFARLRSSHDEMVAGLQGKPRPLTRRLLVVVPSDVVEGDATEVILTARARRALDHLQRMGLEPQRLGAADLEALVHSDEVEEHSCEVRAGDRWARTLLVRCHPDRLDEAWLSPLDAEHDLAIHLKRVAASLARATTYLTLWADDSGAVESATLCAEEILSSYGVAFRRPHLQAAHVFAAGLPLCFDMEAPPLPVEIRTAPNASISRDRGRNRSSALLYGVDPGSQQPLTFDRFAMESPNAVVLGDAGSGRSFIVQLELLRARLAGVPAHVIDLTRADVQAAAAFGGEVIAPTLDSRTPFDPFSLHCPTGSLQDRIRALTALVELLAGGLSEAVLPIVMDALAFAYAARGYTGDGDHSERTPPCLGDVEVALQLRAVRASTSQRAALEAIVHRLERYARGEGRRLLERPAVCSSERAAITWYSLGGLPQEDRPAAMLLSLDHVWGRLPGTRRALVFVDRIDPLLLHETSSRFVAHLMQGATTRQAGLTLVAGDVAGIVGGPLRDAVLRAGMQVLLRQSATGMALLAEAFHLTPAEQSWLSTVPPGEGLLLAEGKRLAFKAIASDEERRLITEGGAG
jgi:hypothetical protein